MGKMDLVTPTGRPILLQCAYRLPVHDYERLLTLCKQRKTNVSKFSREIIQRALEEERQHAPK